MASGEFREGWRPGSNGGTFQPSVLSVTLKLEPRRVCRLAYNTAPGAQGVPPTDTSTTGDLKSAAETLVHCPFPFQSSESWRGPCPVIVNKETGLAWLQLHTWPC